mgnify:CR=1 FL=1
MRIFVTEKNLLDLVYMHPGGVRTAMRLFFLMYHLRNILVPNLSKLIDLLSDLLTVAELFVNRNLVKL